MPCELICSESVNSFSVVFVGVGVCVVGSRCAREVA